LRRGARREIDERIGKYFSALSPMRNQPLAVRAAELSAFLQIVAEGDSWFDYPRYLERRGGIIPRLSERLEDRLAAESILNLAHHGDTVEQMLGVAQRTKLVRVLKEGSFDAILFSGGGNDIAGDQFALWLKERSDSLNAADALREDVFASVLTIVQRGFEDLLAIRNEHAKEAVIFTHAYCVPFPSRRGVCGLGPWLHPALELRGWHDPAEQRAIVRTMLARLDEKLKALAAAAHNNVVHVDTLSIEIAQKNWANEIHPDGDGFDMVTDAFEKVIRKRFNLLG
jgi:hypothetical protein